MIVIGNTRFLDYAKAHEWAFTSLEMTVLFSNSYLKKSDDLAVLNHPFVISSVIDEGYRS